MQRYYWNPILPLLLSVVLSACQGQSIVIPWQGKTIEIVPRGQVAAVEQIQLTSTNTPFMPVQDRDGQSGLTAAAVQQLSTSTDTGIPALVLMSETPQSQTITGTITFTPSITISGTLPTGSITHTITSSFTPSFTPNTRTATATLVLSTATPSKTAAKTTTQTQIVVQNSNTFTQTSLPTQTYTIVPENTQAFTEVVANTNTFTATAVPSGCVYSENYAYESTLIGLINDLRTSLALPPYSSNSLLSNAARGHSQDMACNDYFSHTGLDGSSAASRVAAAGYSYSWVGENIYAGSGSYGTPQMAYNYWYNSPAHYDNMTNVNYTEIGIGFVSCADSTYQNYFTANFARP